jgi:hypothetical protein
MANRLDVLESNAQKLDRDDEATWELEADLREAELESGATKEVPAEEAMHRLRARLAG